MKKLLCFSVLIAAVIFSLVACGSSDTSGETQQRAAGNQPSAAPMSAEPDFTDAREAAAECLSLFYSSEELIKITANDKKIEATIQATSPMGDAQPDDWAEIRTSIEAASSALMGNAAEHEIPNAVIYLVDSSGSIFLTVSNGTVSYDKYDTPEPTPTPTPVATIMVWISSNGERYHRTSTCSNMTGAWQVTPEEAWAMGYTACKHCY